MKVSKNKVLACLTEIAEEVTHNINYVNSGGCAVFSIMLADVLNSLNISDYEFKVFSWDNSHDVSVVENGIIFGVNNIENWYRCNVDFSHVMLRYGKYIIDSNGVVSYKPNMEWDGYSLHKGAISYHTIKELAKIPRNWNEMFARTDIPKMRRIVKSVTKKHFGIDVKPFSK